MIKPANGEPKEGISLFRQEAIDAARGRVGSVIRPVTLTGTMLTLFLAVLLITAVTFAASTQYARKETVAGILEPSQGALRLVAPKPGVVESVSVVDGQLVRAGQPLFVINQDVMTESGASLTSLLDKAAGDQTLALRAQVAARQRSTSGQRLELEAKREGLIAHEGHLATDLELQRQRVRLQQQSLASFKGLNERKIVSDLQYRDRQDAVIQAEQGISTIEKDREDTASGIRQIDGELAKLTGDLEEGEAQLNGSTAQVQEKQAANAVSKEIVVVAPKPGRVVAIQAKVGAPVVNSAALAIILPEGTRLNAELWAPSKAAGFVRVGDRVRLLLDAFPYQKFGVVFGRVTDVAKAPTAPEELTAPIETKEPLYRIDVDLDRQSIDGYGKAWPFTPGMRLNADLILDRRSLVEWLLEPLLAGMKRSQG